MNKRVLPTSTKGRDNTMEWCIVNIYLASEEIFTSSIP